MEYHVTKETPPTFLAVADDDKRCAGCLRRFYQELEKAGVAGELHVYARGGHGFGMNDRPMPVTTWTARLRDWMGDSGYLAQASKTASADASPAKKAYTPPAARIKAPKGFQVELIYSVPRETQGLVGQHDRRSQGPADRLRPVRQAVPRDAPAGRTPRAGQVGVEPIDVPIGEAHGLLWAFDSLYVVVNRGRQV